MSEFTAALVVSPFDNGKTWAIYKEFSYHVGELDSGGDVIVVPVGFETDFASVPWGFRFLIPRWGKYGKAAVIHDYLYSTQEYGDKKHRRRRADEIFREAMEVLDVAGWRRFLMFRAVRVAGWRTWNKNARRIAVGISKILPLPEKATDVRQWG